MLSISCMSLSTPLRNDRRRLSNRVSLDLGLRMKSTTLPPSLWLISKFSLIFDTSPDSNSAGVWVRRWSRVWMVTCSRSGSYSQTFLPLETSSCSIGSSVCQRNSPGRLSASSPAVSCSWVPLPSRVSWEKRAVMVWAWLSNWVRRCTEACSSARAVLLAMLSTASSIMRIMRMEFLIKSVSRISREWARALSLRASRWCSSRSPRRPSPWPRSSVPRGCSRSSACAARRRSRHAGSR